VPAPLAADAELTLPAGPSAHIAKVLRLRPGALVVVFNGGGGEYGAEITALGRDGVRVRIGDYRPLERESPLAVTLLQGVSRGERMDLIVQKATELGVAAIVPVLTEHSVVSLDAAARARRRQRWQDIAASACEQCGRNRVPSVRDPVPLEPACATVATSLRLQLVPDAADALLTAAAGAAALTLLIGPEGGLSFDEIALAERHGFHPCRLGPRILRTETAPIAALAALQAVSGDLRR
jgi:16S rRNA (uracil1498-N3)-methyltransferase